MTVQEMKWLAESIELIKRGITAKVISTDKKMQVYKCGSVIRVDIKEGN